MLYKNQKTRFVGPMMALLLLITSCAKDDENQPSSNDDRDKFLGTWLCTETVKGGPTTAFTINIQSVGSDDTIRIVNFNNLGTPYAATAIVSGSSFVIPNQDITQVIINGTGIYTSQSKISMNYTADSDTLTAVCTK